jgi:hypothetical protein
MVHGDCSSRGCYAMTDEQIGEIYSLGREAFFGGQRAFQVQAYPFRMTPVNLAKHRNNPNMPFWRMIKEGYDHFEVTHLEPKVDFCEHRYVFDAQAPAGSTKALAFNPSAACPAYEVQPDIAEAVRAKQAQDDAKIAELISRGTPTARLNTGIDGGMNAVFASKVQNGQTGLSEPESFSLASYLQLPTAEPTPVINLPPSVNPPRAPEAQPSLVASQNATAPRVASATERGAISGGFFNSLGKKPAPTPGETAPVTTASTTASKPATAATAQAALKPPANVPGARPPGVRELKPSMQADANKPAPALAQANAAAAPANSGQAIAGAQPVVPANSFDSRWSSFR